MKIATLRLLRDHEKVGFDKKVKIEEKKPSTSLTNVENSQIENKENLNSIQGHYNRTQKKKQNYNQFLEECTTKRKQQLDNELSHYVQEFQILKESKQPSQSLQESNCKDKKIYEENPTKIMNIYKAQQNNNHQDLDKYVTCQNNLKKDKKNTEIQQLQKQLQKMEIKIQKLEQEKKSQEILHELNYNQKDILNDIQLSKQLLSLCIQNINNLENKIINQSSKPDRGQSVHYDKCQNNLHRINTKNYQQIKNKRQSCYSRSPSLTSRSDKHDQNEQKNYEFIDDLLSIRHTLTHDTNSLKIDMSDYEFEQEQTPKILPVPVPTIYQPPIALQPPKQHLKSEDFNSIMEKLNDLYISKKQADMDLDKYLDGKEYEMKILSSSRRSSTSKRNNSN